MPAITGHDVIDPKNLDSRAKQELIDSLYDVHARIFDGVDRASFARYVVESRAEQTRIFLHRNARGEIVGYFALHVFERMHAGQMTAIFRAEAGTLSEYRGGNVNGKLGVKFGLEYLAAHPGRPMVYLGSLVHPSSYSLFASYSDQVWPNAEVEPPAEITAFMTELAASFGLDPVSEENPFIYKVGWKTRDSAADHAFWTTTDKAGARFFLEANPGYREGHGLLTLVPITPAGLARLGGRYAAAKVRRRVVNLGKSVGRGLRGLLPAPSAQAA